MSLQPSAGVRILLEQDGEADGAGARYRGAILLPTERFDFEVALGADAAVRITPRGESGSASGPGERALELLRTIARTVGRHAIAESPPAWPRRVLRWRKL